MGVHEIKGKSLQINRIFSKEQAKILIENILTYSEEFPLSELDLVYRKWVEDLISTIDPAAFFVGSFPTLPDLEAAFLPADIKDGSYGFVGTGVDFKIYYWDLTAQEWQVVHGDPGPPPDLEALKAELDLRYFRKDEDDETTYVASVAKIVLTDTDESEIYEYFLGVRADGSVVKVTPAVAGGDKNKEFTVSEAVETWIVVHNMGKKPCFNLKDSSGNPLYPRWDWIDNNTIEFYFDGIQSGGGVLN